MILNDLKDSIERIEGRTKRFVAADVPQPDPWTTGLSKLDTALPQNALAYDACHDFTPLVKTDVPQVAGFIFALLQRLPQSRSGGGGDGRSDRGRFRRSRRRCATGAGAEEARR